jgi:hypothetical protein
MRTFSKGVTLLGCWAVLQTAVVFAALKDWRRATDVLTICLFASVAAILAFAIFSKLPPRVRYVTIFTVIVYLVAIGYMFYRFATVGD